MLKRIPKLLNLAHSRTSVPRAGEIGILQSSEHLRFAIKAQILHSLVLSAGTLLQELSDGLVWGKAGSLGHSERPVLQGAPLFPFALHDRAHASRAQPQQEQRAHPLVLAAGALLQEVSDGLARGQPEAEARAWWLRR